jgi:hypothetical protein
MAEARIEVHRSGHPQVSSLGDDYGPPHSGLAPPAACQPAEMDPEVRPLPSSNGKITSDSPSPVPGEDRELYSLARPAILTQTES